MKLVLTFLFLFFFSFFCFVLSSVSLKVGGITCAAGIVGVWLGAEIARRYKVRNRKADAIVCAVALLGSAPFLYVCLVLAAVDVKVTYVCTLVLFIISILILAFTHSPKVVFKGNNCRGAWRKALSDF